MDLICIDNEYYDPYFILQVSKDDLIKDKKKFKKELSTSYKKKILKYHPDKTKNEDLKFRIVQESYNYILKHIEYISPKKEKYYKPLEEDIIDFKNISKDKNDKIQKKLEKKEREKKEREEKFDIINQFKNRKFSNDEFNKLFEYIKQESEENDNVNIEETIDGFNGFNQNYNQSMVSSYNGLMITYDNTINECENNYTELFNKTRNPTKMIDIKKIPEKKKVEYKKIYDDSLPEIGEIKTAEENLYSTIYNKLKQKEEQDKQNIIKNASKLYKKELINECFDKKLECNKTLLSVLDKHFYTNRIKN